MRHQTIHTILLLLFLGSAVLGDILTIRNQGNTPVPIAQVSLQFDPPKIKRVKDGDGVEKITWSFTIRSKGTEAIDTQIAFPVTSRGVLDARTRERARRYIYERMVVTGNGEKLPVQYPRGRGYQLTTGVLSWKPGETKTIVCESTWREKPPPGGMGPGPGWAEYVRSIKDALPSGDELRASAVSTQPFSAAREADISMENEIVRIVEKAYRFRVTCTFEMKSHAKGSLTRVVGFPVASSELGKHMKRSFKVTVDEKRADTSLQVGKQPSWARKTYGKPGHQSFAYPTYVAWPVTWAAGQTRTVVCTYEMGRPEYARGGLGQCSRLPYVVQTGALWRGNVGEADISIEFERDPRTRDTGARDWRGKIPKSAFHMSHSGHAKWTSARKLEWHFKDWNPKEDMVAEWSLWQGMHGSYRLTFPQPYEGGTKRYSEEMLNALVEKELAPWRRDFPEETAEFKRPALKAHIADCLYHEILARHGEPFVIGIADDLPPVGENTMGGQANGGPGEMGGMEWTAQRHLTGKWRSYFDSYVLHGGWYRPDNTKKVLDWDLNEAEQANRAFLKPFLPRQEEGAPR